MEPVLLSCSNQNIQLGLLVDGESVASEIAEIRSRRAAARLPQDVDRMAAVFSNGVAKESLRAE